MRSRAIDGREELIRHRPRRRERRSRHRRRVINLLSQIPSGRQVGDRVQDCRRGAGRPLANRQWLDDAGGTFVVAVAAVDRNVRIAPRHQGRADRRIRHRAVGVQRHRLIHVCSRAIDGREELIRHRPRRRERRSRHRRRVINLLSQIPSGRQVGDRVQDCRRGAGRPLANRQWLDDAGGTFVVAVAAVDRNVRIAPRYQGRADRRIRHRAVGVQRHRLVHMRSRAIDGREELIRHRPRRRERRSRHRRRVINLLSQIPSGRQVGDRVQDCRRGAGRPWPIVNGSTTPVEPL